MTKTSLATLRVNEIFYSLQGEGRFTGTPAIFLRLSGCNLSCPFCDTSHTDATCMTLDAIISELSCYPARHLVITGGEPAMQLTAEIICRLHQEGYFIQVETNGTLPLPPGIDWVTCSPKTDRIGCGHVDELKLLFIGDGTDESRIARFDHLDIACRSLQPCDHTMIISEGIDVAQRNLATIAGCIAYIKLHPRWRLSLQTHKLLNIP